jgi:hypothetical protein
VIRWFQLQAHTHVVLNTGRAESMRSLTLDSLNALAALHRVSFDPELLFMNRSGAEGDVSSAKVEALEQLRNAGARGHQTKAARTNAPSSARAALAAPGRVHARER